MRPPAPAQAEPTGVRRRSQRYDAAVHVPYTPRPRHMGNGRNASSVGLARWMPRRWRSCRRLFVRTACA